MGISRIRCQKVAAFALCFIAVAILADGLSAQPLNVRIENLQPTDGFWLTPFWVGFHDGSFDVYSSGDPAANFPGLEEIAEGGDTQPLHAEFNTVSGRSDTTITAPAGFGDPPVFDPGDVVDKYISVSNSASNRYFSYASMVIPSNDAFVANGNPLAYMVYDAGGNFVGPITSVES